MHRPIYEIPIALICPLQTCGRFKVSRRADVRMTSNLVLPDYRLEYMRNAYYCDIRHGVPIVTFAQLTAGRAIFASEGQLSSRDVIRDGPRCPRHRCFTSSSRID